MRVQRESWPGEIRQQPGWTLPPQIEDGGPKHQITDTPASTCYRTQHNTSILEMAMTEGALVSIPLLGSRIKNVGKSIDNSIDNVLYIIHAMFSLDMNACE